MLDSLAAAIVCALASLRTRWGLAAGLLYAFQPGMVNYTNAILVETLLAFLLTVTIALLVRGGWPWAAAAGVTLGLAALCRANFVPFVAVGALLLWFASRRRMAVAFCAAALVTIAPWTIRSSMLAGRFVLMQSCGYVNLALAAKQGPWNLNDQASFYRNPAYTRDDPCGRINGAWLLTPREAAEGDDICRRETFENLKKNPGYYLRSRISQLIHFPLTSFDFVTGNTLTFGAALAQRQYRVLAVKVLLYVLFSLMPLALAIVGVVFGAPTIEKRLAGALWIFVFLIYAPGFVEYRYFLAAVPMLLVTAAFGMDRLTSRT